MKLKTNYHVKRKNRIIDQTREVAGAHTARASKTVLLVYTLIMYISIPPYTSHTEGTLIMTRAVYKLFRIYFHFEYLKLTGMSVFFLSGTSVSESYSALDPFDLPGPVVTPPEPVVVPFSNIPPQTLTFYSEKNTFLFFLIPFLCLSYVLII